MLSSSETRGLRELYELLSELPEAERGDWLREHCPDPALREQLALLLRAQQRTFDPLAVAPGERLRAIESAGDVQLRQIGDFTLIRPVGQGGMATVWLAERSGFEQRVALKLLHRTILSELDRKLFERERRVLASLEHPNIARLIDGGISAARQPWLAMEYVEGEPLTAYAQRQRLSPRARVALLLEVCEAVAAAHARLVVHRDLKPGNVLVGVDGRVKLLDFGVAKVLADEVDLTGQGCAGFTPAYAAPEQVAGGEISMATDVYALGVIGLELLLGERDAGLRSLPASQQVLRIEATESAPATRRELVRFLRGDLDNVLRRCLLEEPERRYPGAQALADDLRRFLDDQPVSAHPLSRWYLVRKFARRHRGGVVLTALLSAATLASLVLALWLGAQAREQARLAGQAAAAEQQARERAQSALRVSEEVQDFLVGLFDEAVPSVPDAAEPSVRELVMRAEARIEGELADAPDVAAELYRRLVQIHNVMGADADALRLSAQARSYALAHFPAGSQSQRIAIFSDGMLRARNGDSRGVADMEAALAQAAPGDSSLETLAQRVSLGVLLTQRGRVAEGLGMLESALVSLKPGCAAGDSEQCELEVTALNNLGVAHFAARNYRLAREFAARAEARSRQVHGEQHRESAKALGNLGMIESYLGETAAALEHTQAAITAIEAIEGPRGAGANALRQTLANLLGGSGRALDALAVHEQVIAAESGRDPRSPALGVYRVNYAKALLNVGRYDDAQAQMDGMRAVFEADPAGHESNLPRMHEVYAVIAAERDGDPVAAAAAGARALALRHAQQPLRPQELASTLLISQRAAALAGETPQSAAWLAELREVYAGIGEPLPNLRRGWLLRQAELALAAGDPGAARRHCAALLTDIGAARPQQHADRVGVLELRIAAAEGQPTAADPAWLADLEARWGAQAPIVREASLGPR